MNEYSHLAHYYDQIGREYAADMNMIIVTACQDPEIRKIIEPLRAEVVEALNINDIKQRKRKVKVLLQQIKDICGL